MRDPIEELKSLAGDVSPTPLPPSEVRRRGDRRRRRRTVVQVAGATAAAAVIASGGALLNGALTATAPDPGPAIDTPRPSPVDTAVGNEGGIPEDFPVGAGLGPMPEPAEAAVARDDQVDQRWLAVPCSSGARDRWFSGDEARTAARGLEVRGDSAGRLRQVFVYDDAVAAGKALSGFEKRMDSCASSGSTASGGRAMAWQLDTRPGLGTPEESLWVAMSGSSTTDASDHFFTEVIATRVGRSIVVSERGQAEPYTDARLATSHGVVVRAMCRWTEDACASQGSGGPDPSGDLLHVPSTPSAEEPASTTWLTEIPARLRIDQGLPEAGGDVPQWARSTGPAVPLSAVACGGAERLPVPPVSSVRVEVSPPDENAWRHLLLFEDDVAASEAYTQTRSSAAVCGETTAVNDDGDPAEVRWQFVEPDAAGPAVLQIRGLSYADGTDVRTPGRTLTHVVRVGNALFVARLDDASSAGSEEAVARRFAADVGAVAKAMCTFAADPCVSR